MWLQIIHNLLVRETTSLLLEQRVKHCMILKYKEEFCEPMLCIILKRRESGSTSDFVILNPLASTEIDGQIPLGATGFSSGAVTDAAKGGTIAPNSHDVNPVQFGETLVGRYMGICGDNNNDNILTNRVFEIRENDKKREIRLLHPQFLVDAVEEFERVINTGSIVG